MSPVLHPAGLTDTVFFDLVGEDGGEPWRIFLHRPPGPAPEGGWPLLAITDGNAMIATAVDAVRVQGAYPGGTNVAPGVVMAIGYPTEGAYDPWRRSFDLSPPPGRAYPPFAADGPEVRTGGADRFLRFIEREALAAADAITPINPARRTLFGHSFGGLFALHALFSGTRAFTRFVAASPTIGWEDGVLTQTERRFLEAPALGGEVVVHLSAGEYEGDALAPFQYGREDTAERLERARTVRTAALTSAMAERLARVPNLRVLHETYPGETHMTMLPIAVSRAVRVAFPARED
ncbi:alpha/beta hydrolase-fold protein [Aureimonas sp. ME7]|uniref:alpha/beta hydrolase n=1 Tax=Aureimonas sp. ME7 TaxID=2744252 RepID=UPI0015F718F7|nr:alpha/beta hydrolase-fold protein [Aureimonas sp. ME7]